MMRLGLAVMIVELQQIGCHNINFVTRGHVVPQIPWGRCRSRSKGRSAAEPLEPPPLTAGLATVHAAIASRSDRLSAEGTARGGWHVARR
jgi:hypothetical protein